MIVIWQDLPESTKVFQVEESLFDWSKIHDKYINGDDDVDEVLSLAEYLETIEPIAIGPEGLLINDRIIMTGQFI